MVLYNFRCTFAWYITTKMACDASYLFGFIPNFSIQLSNELKNHTVFLRPTKMLIIWRRQKCFLCFSHPLFRPYSWNCFSSLKNMDMSASVIIKFYARLFLLPKSHDRLVLELFTIKANTFLRTIHIFTRPLHSTNCFYVTACKYFNDMVENLRSFSNRYNSTT